MNKYQLPFFTSFFRTDDTRYHSWFRYATQVYNAQAVSNDLRIPNTKSIFLKTTTQFDKKTHTIHDILTSAQKYSSKFVFINSDIEIDIDDIFWDKIVEASNHGVVMGHRFNYETSYNESSINANGVDFYILNDKIIIPDDDNFCIGLCGWDWWIPYLAIQQQIPVYRIDCPFLYHKIHPKQWSKESLAYICDYMFKITGEIHDRQFKDKIVNQTIPLCKIN
jgi:hypothetical protein